MTVSVKDKFRSKRNGKIATVIKVADHGVIIELEGEEEYKLIAETTLQRWYEPLNAEPEKVEPKATPLSMEAKQSKSTKPAKPKKSNTSGSDYTDVIDNFLNFITKMKEEYGITIFNEGKNKNFYSLKVDGRIYMAFTVGKLSGVNLWLRSKAVEGMCEFKKLNHMLDARVIISDWSMETYQKVVKLHDACLKFQMEKNNAAKK